MEVKNELDCDVYYENAISTLKTLENNKDLVRNSLFLLGCNVAAELFLSSVCAVASSRYGWLFQHTVQSF